MSLFDDNDDSLLEKPLFLRINTEKNVFSDKHVFNNINNETVIIDDSDDSDCSDEALKDNSNKKTNDSAVMCSQPDLATHVNMAVNDEQWSDCCESSNNSSQVKPKFINNGSVISNKQISPKKLSKILTQNKELKSTREKREELRKEKRTEKELRKLNHNTNKEVLKTKSVKESLKHCYAIIDTDLYDMCSQNIQQIFDEKEAKYELTDRSIVPMSVIWNRKEFSCAENTDLLSNVNIVERDVQQNHILIVIDAKQFVDYVYAFINKIGKSLFDYVLEIKTLIGDKNLTLIVYKLDQYFKREKSKSNNEFRQRFNQLSSESQSTKCSQNTDLPTISKDDIDLAIIDLNVKLLGIDSDFKVSLTKVNDSNGLATQIFRITRSIAESHARQHKNMQQNFEWCAEVDNRNTVDPIDHKSFLSLWRKQLMQFPNISYEIANAIVTKYPSPMSLLDAYSNADKPEMLLSDIKVSRRQASGGFNERKIGNELSYRIHLFITSKNGNELLNRV